ncbi:acyl carrier protein [Pyxidicoccus sp. 3LG]
MEQNNSSRVDELMNFLKQGVLIDRLEVECDSADAIDVDDALFDPKGIGLDSVEALEIMAALEGTYKVSFQGLPEEVVREGFRSVRSLAAFVDELLTVATAPIAQTA